jgi:hypothetical protein
MADDEKNSKPPQDEKSEKSKVERLLTKIKEHILLLAGVVAALSTLVGGIISLIKPFTPPDTKPSSNPPAGQLVVPVVTPEKCFSARHLKPNQIPHYLLPSMGSSENFPYWLKFVGENNCNKKLMLKVHFEPEAGVVLNAGDSASLVIDPQKKFSLTVAPDDIRLTSDEVKQVKISYTVKDEQGTAIDGGQISAKVVEPYTVAWDLQRPGKTDDAAEPVDRDYLLKSLAAWVFRPPEIIALRARECRTAPDGGPKLIKEAALQSCYENLFRGAGKISVNDASIRLPSEPKQKILPPAVAVQEKSASSLEAALLFAAVMERERSDGIDPHLVLLAAAEGAASGLEKSVYIAWREASGAWKGFNLRKANQRNFEENIAAGEFNSILTPEIAADLENKGIFRRQDDAVVAIDFKKIKDEGEIYALPK